MEYFVPKMLRTLSLYNWGLVQDKEIGPTFLGHFILYVSGRILNHEQKFSNTITRNP